MRLFMANNEYPNVGLQRVHTNHEAAYNLFPANNSNCVWSFFCVIHLKTGLVKQETCFIAYMRYTPFT